MERISLNDWIEKEANEAELKSSRDDNSDKQIRIQHYARTTRTLWRIVDLLNDLYDVETREEGIFLVPKSNAEAGTPAKLQENKE